MIKNILKVLAIILVVLIAGIWLGFVRKSFTIDQSIDYSIKSAVTVGVLMLVSYIISLITPQK